jgi:hypothetical protein
MRRRRSESTVNEPSSLAEHRFCAQCGAERLGTFCWRCGAPALGDRPAPAPLTQPEHTEPAERAPLGAALAPLWGRVAVFAAPAGAAVAALAALAFPWLGLLIGVGGFIALARALRARVPAAAGDRAPSA